MIRSKGFFEDRQVSGRYSYLDMAVFPEDQPLPESALSVLWKLDDIDTRDCMTRLVAHSLATFGNWRGN